MSEVEQGLQKLIAREIVKLAKLIEEDAREFVRNWMDRDTWEDLAFRVDRDHQPIGQAFMNAGDHHDQEYSWKLTWDDLKVVDTWVGLVEKIESIS